MVGAFVINDHHLGGVDLVLQESQKMARVLIISYDAGPLGI